ncbi:MAG: hypothetical protein EBZ61_06865 [Micrococcales bacterium]|nr:hypothetical protein [Micrococcales bacterium]
MSGIQFLSKILGLAGLIIRKDASNRQVSIDLSSYQEPNTSLLVTLPYRNGQLAIVPSVDGTPGQVLATNGDGTTDWVTISFPADSVTSVNGETGAVVLDAADVGAITLTEKGVANGVATLGLDGLVPASQLPPVAIGVSSVNGETGDVVLDAADVGAVALADKGVANGVASLNAQGIVPYSQLPQIPGVAAPIDFYGSVSSNSTSGTVFTLNSTIYRSFVAQISVFIENNSESFMLLGAYNGSAWNISPSSAGKNSGVTFSMDADGVLSFSDSSAQAKSISYQVQAIDKTLESFGKKQEKGSSSSSSASGSLFTVDVNAYKSFMAQVSVFVDAGTDLAETFVLLGSNTGSTWLMGQSSAGNNSGVTFDINSAGVVSFSDIFARAKSFSYQYTAIDNFIGKTSSSASSGTIATISPIAFRGFTAQVSVFVDAATDLAETFYLIGANNGTSWLMTEVSTGQSTGVSFSINSSGVLSFSDALSQNKILSYRIEPIVV